MSERNGYQQGVPCWITNVSPDAETTAAFYAGLFGWETENLMPAGAEGDYIACRLRGRDVAAVVSQHGAPPPPQPVWTTHVWVDSADETARAVTAAGGSVLGDRFDSPGGVRTAVVADPAGAAFCLLEPGERRGAQVVNEPGAWSMSALNTSDPDGAAAFYEAVFGWTTETFEMGEIEATMLRLPGFEGGEPQQPVSREVVAVMLPTDDQEPNWSVDIWIDDADAAAQRATSLGGSVPAPPFETPLSRTAVLADPQGAAFSVSEVPGVEG
jgi:predicted enzyme related to lactoylglutathione lyase